MSLFDAAIWLFIFVACDTLQGLPRATMVCSFIACAGAATDSYRGSTSNWADMQWIQEIHPFCGNHTTNRKQHSGASGSFHILVRATDSVLPNLVVHWAYTKIHLLDLVVSI
ncbi:unnamed protein product [Ostreobium quekettii]|uniref:Secreted protein n=1 Tax=Ostreobium quekettii TaxID=121088 RepID=A0A8S1INW9_9CHLO|nr:unnamed protein product [Ostreobium quekettii]